MITEIEDYLARGCGRCNRFDTPECSTVMWALGLANLRAICLDTGLEEVVKWGHPCYMFAGRNIAVMGAFRGDFRLSFFNAALMADPEGVLEPAGPNTPVPGVLRFREASDVGRMARTIRAYLDEAMGYAKEGKLPEKRPQNLVLPTELADALDSDPDLADGFHALTPGRQKSYVLNLNSAKTSETRIRRIEKFRDKIIAGKGATDR